MKSGRPAVAVLILFTLPALRIELHHTTIMHVSMPSVLSSTHRPRLYCKINSSAMHQWLLPRSAAFSRTSTVAYCSTRPACLNSHVVFPANQQCSWTTNHETLKRSQARAALVPSYSKRSSSMHRCNAYASVNDQSAAAEDFYSLLGIVRVRCWLTADATDD